MVYTKQIFGVAYYLNNTFSLYNNMSVDDPCSEK